MTSSAQSQKASLTVLNTYVSLHRPIRAEVTDPTHPSIVLLFGWMDAKTPHLQKYIDGMHSIFPATTIVLIRASSTYYFTTQRQLEQHLLPVIDIIRGEVNSGARFGGLLSLLLSNAGGWQLVTFRKVLAKNPILGPDGGPLRAQTALVLDSLPGENALRSSLNSLAPKSHIRYVLLLLPITAVVVAYYTINTLRWNPDIFQELRRTLSSPNAFPSLVDPADPHATPLLYICSDDDIVVRRSSIAEHAAAARGNGIDVSIEDFGLSPHIAHARTDPKKYWSAIARFWDKTVTASGGRALSARLSRL